jgi:hypothetical protein
MPAAAKSTFHSQHVPHHPAAGKRTLKMQLVDPTHQTKTGFADRTGTVVNRTPAERGGFRLFAERQRVPTVYHRFTLNRPAFASADSKKSFSSASSPILA